jgi:hypothetical protein
LVCSQCSTSRPSGSFAPPDSVRFLVLMRMVAVRGSITSHTTVHHRRGLLIAHRRGLVIAHRRGWGEDESIAAALDLVRA